LSLHRIYFNPRAHGCGQGNFADIDAFGGCRAGFPHGLHQGSHVLIQLLFIERGLANRDVQVGGLIHPEFDPAGFDLLNDSGNIFGRHDCSGFGIRHQTTRAKDPA
jgi:hypothetical protein